MAKQKDTEQTFSEETRKIIEDINESVRKGLIPNLGSEESIHGFCIGVLKEISEAFKIYNPKDRISKLSIDFTTGYCEIERLYSPAFPLEQIELLAFPGCTIINEEV